MNCNNSTPNYGFNTCDPCCAIDGIDRELNRIEKKIECKLRHPCKPTHKPDKCPPPVGCACDCYTRDEIDDFLADKAINGGPIYWEPEIFGDEVEGSPTYRSDNRRGVCYCVGNLCFLSFDVGITSKGGMEGNVCVRGFPCIPLESASGSANDTYALALEDGQICNSVYLKKGANHIRFRVNTKDGIAKLDASQIKNVFDCYGVSIVFPYKTQD